MHTPGTGTVSLRCEYGGGSRGFRTVFCITVRQETVSRAVEVLGAGLAVVVVARDGADARLETVVEVAGLAGAGEMSQAGR